MKSVRCRALGDDPMRCGGEPFVYHFAEILAGRYARVSHFEPPLLAWSGIMSVGIESIHRGSVHTEIERKLRSELEPEHLVVVNESHRHNVPAGSESHFKVVVVSPRFAGMGRLARHRLVNRILRDEIAGRVHALALHTLTPEEWSEVAGAVPASPECAGGDGSLPKRNS